jgi:hypothetical protein
VTETHAIEFYFGKGWVESIGQDLQYSMQTAKKAGIILTLESVKDRKRWIRLNSMIQHFNMPIDAWNIGNAAYKGFVVFRPGSSSCGLIYRFPA